MAKNDWAIVVGIQCYPALGDLGGPDNDARAFRDWLIDPAGGAVPEDHVNLIVTSQWKIPFRSVRSARPTEERIREAIEDLQDIAQKNAEQTGDRRVGRRLYLYLAGHGFAPGDNKTALLMANATKQRVGPPYHVLAEYTADWFYHAGYFGEILLFMDCCREVYAVPALNMPFKDELDPGAIDRVKRFYVSSTKWSRLSRELPMAGGVVHGVFTAALLEGLRGKACAPNTGGQITTESLAEYLQTNMKTFLPPALLADPQVPKEPDIPPFADKFLVATAPIAVDSVTVHLSPGSAGKEVKILGDQFREVAHTIAVPPVWQLSLERGFYLAQILADGLQQPFEVKGIGGVNVTL
jgi:uncharacterized caspase-like protein